MKKTNYLKLGSAVATAVLLMAGGLARAGDVTWDFETDPATGANPLTLGGNIVDSGDPEFDGMWRFISGAGEGSGSDGFLALTYPTGDQRGYAIFPDIDNGMFITSFEMTTDIRSGNSTGDRAADGWSVSLARDGDAALSNPGDMASFGGAYEFGTQTGIAISFDTWSGNTFPDGSSDIEGLIVRVDGTTVTTVGLPTRHGACDDDTSLQTGPRDPDYWTAGGDPYAPECWSQLCWQQLRVVVSDTGNVSVYWKGRTILEDEPTDFFPSAGQIVLAARTGGANSNVHFDNLHLVTTAVEPETEPPTDPGDLTVGEVGAARVELSWGESTDNSGRVGYEVERDGTILPGIKTETSMEDRSVLPETTYGYRVRATDVAGNKSAWVPATPVSVTTAAEVSAKGFVKGTIYDGIDGAIPILTAIQDPIYTSGAFTRVAYFPGIDFSNFGDNYLIDIEATLIPPVSGDYRFFVGSDDASELFLNTSGPDIPDPNLVFPIATETDCCDAFQEPGVANDDGTTYPTSDPISLTAGQAYGFRFLVKEGGGGDWGQVAWRMEGDPTPAGQLQPIRGLVLEGVADPVGSTLTITTQPQSQTVVANERVELSVAVDYTNPYGVAPVYQWFKDGTPIPFASGTTHVIPVVASGDAGTYTVTAYLSGVEATSDDAVLTVNADTLLPTITSVSSDDTFTQLLVGYSEPLTAAGTYTLDGGATVSSATLSADKFSVTLVTSALTPGTDYTLTANGATDNAGNAIAADSTATFSTFVDTPGEMRAYYYTGIGGTAVADFTGNAKFPDSPDDIQLLASFADTDGYGDNYGVMVRGYFMPDTTGSYDFFIRSDDASQLFLNTSGSLPPDPLTSTAIAEETGCCNAFLEPGAAQTTASPISLTAGQMYGFTAMMKEGGGGDYVHVAWRLTTDSTAADALPDIAPANFGTFAPVVTANPMLSISTEANGDITLTYEGTLESSGTVDGTYAPVSGASSPHTVTPSGAMMYFRASQ